MISIVIVGRNDDYGGDFQERLLATTRYNVGELVRRGVEHEVVFVEWNPLPDRPMLSERVVAEFEAARCVVVDGAVHRRLSQNRFICVYEYHAKNVGVRVAGGEWILLMNPDNYLGREILDFLGAGDFDPEMLYRAGWIEIEGEAEVDAAGLCDRYGDDPPPYVCASGDFAFCSKTLLDRIGGYREDLPFTNTHKDAILCVSAHELTGRVCKVGCTYHLRHDREQQGTRRIDYRWDRVDRTRQATYGLAEGCVEAPLSPRITGLRLRDDLAEEAYERTIPEPHVPRAYRPRRPPWYRGMLSRLRRA